MTTNTPLKKTNVEKNVEASLKKSIRELLDRQDIKNSVTDGRKSQLFVDAEMLKRYIAYRVKIEVNNCLNRLPH